MSDISKINVEGIDYDIKDNVARESLNKAPNNCNTGLIRVNSEEELNDILETELNNLKDNQSKLMVIGVLVSGLSLPGGNWFTWIHKASINHAIVESVSYMRTNKIYRRVKSAGEWGTWVAYTLNE